MLCDLCQADGNMNDAYTSGLVKRAAPKKPEPEPEPEPEVPCSRCAPHEAGAVERVHAGEGGGWGRCGLGYAFDFDAPQPEPEPDEEPDDWDDGDSDGVEEAVRARRMLAFQRRRRGGH